MSILDQSFPNSTGCLGCFTKASHPFSALRYNMAADQHQHQQQQQVLTGEDQQKKQEMDTLLSEAFNTLTFEERQVQQEQLHGVGDQIQEEASLIENSLAELESHILRTKAGSVYETAERMNPDYVHARSFRIMFLRAERYDAKAAADRVMRFFEEKEKLFGTEKLTQDITIDDLDEDDIASLKSGAIQWGGTDRSNRPILLQLPGLRKFKELKNELRPRYFVMMEAAKSPEAQLRGIVALTYTVGDFRDRAQGHGFLEHSRLSEAIPLYPGAFHYASDDLKQHVLGTFAISLMAVTCRARVRLHFGTHMECHYHLSTFGIPSGSLPFLPETNTIDLEPHLQWCQKYFAKNLQVTEPSSSLGTSITEPNPNDVLTLGSKKVETVGNDNLRELVKQSLDAYRCGSYDEKRHIVDRIIAEIHGTGGRFLQQDKGSKTWKELSLAKTRLKIAQRFRNHNRKRETASQQAHRGTLIADTPRPNDVIFGRAQRSTGNDLLHNLIKERSEEYEAMNRGMKAVVVDSIIDHIKSEGGRFLQPTQDLDEGYVELSTDSIRDRISIYFRNYRRPPKNATLRSGKIW